MSTSILVLILLFPLSVQAKLIKTSEIPWLSQLAAKNIREFHVCGSSEIQPTKKSLSKDFALSPQQTGFLLSDLVSYQQYFETLSEKNSEEAKTILQNEFNKAHLWKYSKEKGFEDLGTPSKITVHFSVSIKDCVGGAKTPGKDCSRHQGKSRDICCAEKFPGMTAFWGENDEYRLMYSPDPSVRLKVPGESNHRYCNVQKSITLQ